MVSKFLSKTTGQNDAHSNLQAARHIHAGTCRGACKTTHTGFFEYNCFTRFCNFSAVPWSESAVGIHTSPPFWTSRPPTPHPTPLGHHRAWTWLPVLQRRFPRATCLTHGSTHICQRYTPDSSTLLSPSPPRPLSTCPFLTSASPFLTCKQAPLNCFSRFHIICVHIWYLFFSAIPHTVLKVKVAQ